MINLLIAGYHGYKNCGDEATLLAMTTNIREIADDVNITAISCNPEKTKTEYNINSVQRFNAFELLKAIIKSDIILSGGGTLIQNGTSTRSLMYYLGIIKVGKFFRKRVMLYANGIGPVTGGFNRFLVKLVVNSVDLITLREKFSEQDLRLIGVNKPHIYVTADAAFTVKSIDGSEAEKILEKEGVPLDKEIIGVSVRAWSKAKDGEKYIKEIAKACDNMARQGKTILLIPMQLPRDTEISKKLIGMMKERAYIIEGEYSPAETVGIIGRCDLILGMRLHALLFAAIKRVPMLGIVYDPKVEYYLDVLKMPSAGDIRCDNLDEKRLTARMEGLFYDLEKYRGILDRQVSQLVEKAKENDSLLSGQLDIIRENKKRRNKQ